MSDEQKNSSGGTENNPQSDMGNTPELKLKGVNKKLLFGIACIIALAVVVVLVILIPKNATAKKVSKQLSLGEKYLSELNYEQAIAAYELAIQIDPKNEDAYIGLAEVYIVMGDWDKAEEVLKEAEEKVGATDSIRKKQEEVSEKKAAKENQNTQPDITPEPMATPIPKPTATPKPTPTPIPAVFGSIDGLEYKIVNGKEVVIRGHENEQLTELVIPNEIEGLPVTEIGDYAFRDRESLASVKLPEGLERIGEAAFVGSGIREITFPDGLIRIDEWAFACCEIREITIPESVTEIGGFAFYRCDSLTEVLLPVSVTTVSAPFQHCESLEKIRVAAENPAYCSVDGVLYSKDKKVLVQYPAGKSEETYKVLDGTVEIGAAAFDGGKFSEVLLPEGLEVIGSSAFWNCHRMTEIIFPSSLKEISRDGIFAACDSLENIRVKQENEYFTVVEGVLYSKEMTALIVVPEKKDLSNYQVPAGITVIYGSAFELNESLVELELPEGVKEIGSSAFWNRRLEKIVIPRSVEKIGSRAFNDAVNLTIYTPAGSYAETYAKENNIPVVIQ